MSRAKSQPRFPAEPLTPHAYVPMWAWIGCYVCLRLRADPIHSTAARLTPAKAANDGG